MKITESAGILHSHDYGYGLLVSLESDFIYSLIVTLITLILKVLAGALLDSRLGRDWRWEADVAPPPQYTAVMEQFRDHKAAQYSIHQISLMGESLDKKPVGTWFGPNTVAQVRMLGLSERLFKTCFVRY